MNSFLVACLLGLGFIGVDEPKKETEFYKMNSVMVVVDSIESVEQTDRGCTIYLESGRRVYTPKDWTSVRDLIQKALDKDQEYIVVYQKKYSPVTKSKNPIPKS